MVLRGRGVIVLNEQEPTANFDAVDTVLSVVYSTTYL